MIANWLPTKNSQQLLRLLFHSKLLLVLCACAKSHSEGLSAHTCSCVSTSLPDRRVQISECLCVLFCFPVGTISRLRVCRVHTAPGEDDACKLLPSVIPSLTPSSESNHRSPVPTMCMPCARLQDMWTTDTSMGFIYAAHHQSTATLQVTALLDLSQGLANHLMHIFLGTTDSISSRA